MIKPATKPGIPAIRELTARGVNVTSRGVLASCSPMGPRAGLFGDWAPWAEARPVGTMST
jgi:hypothetical protein